MFTGGGGGGGMRGPPMPLIERRPYGLMPTLVCRSWWTTKRGSRAADRRDTRGPVQGSPPAAGNQQEHLVPDLPRQGQHCRGSRGQVHRLPRPGSSHSAATVWSGSRAAAPTDLPRVPGPWRDDRSQVPLRRLPWREDHTDAQGRSFSPSHACRISCHVID